MLLCRIFIDLKRSSQSSVERTDIPLFIFTPRPSLNLIMVKSLLWFVNSSIVMSVFISQHAVFVGHVGYSMISDNLVIVKIKTKPKLCFDIPMTTRTINRAQIKYLCCNV